MLQFMKELQSDGLHTVNDKLHESGCVEQITSISLPFSLGWFRCGRFLFFVSVCFLRSFALIASVSFGWTINVLLLLVFCFCFFVVVFSCFFFFFLGGGGCFPYVFLFALPPGSVCWPSRVASHDCATSVVTLTVQTPMRKDILVGLTDPLRKESLVGLTDPSKKENLAD